MKKTLSLFIFISLLVTLWAQNSKMSLPIQQALNATSHKSALSNVHFAKSGQVLASVDFHADNEGYSTGVISEGSESHGQNEAYSFWKRWPNVTDSTLSAMSTFYSRLSYNYFGGPGYFVSYMSRYLDTLSSSAENGFMMISLYDQDTRYTGNFNAYIQIDSIDASDTRVLEVSLFEYYRGYYDACYIDYSTDGVNWVENRINVTDISQSNPIWGEHRFNIDLGSTGNSSVSIRIRCKSLDSNRGAYGYFWIVDDVVVYAAEPYRLQVLDQEYTEGNYGMIPQGMTIFPAWCSKVKNIGVSDLSNVESKLYHLNDSRQMSDEIASFNNGDINVNAYKSLVVDPYGWYSLDSIQFCGWYGYSSFIPNGIGGSLPTDTLGGNYVYANISAGALSIDCDTMYYQVTGADANGNYTWAHDNGVLAYSPYNYWLYGYVLDGSNWYFSEDPEEVHFYQQGYAVSSRYTTNDLSGSDWVVKGVEMVASPVDGYHSEGAKLLATLTYDDYNGDSFEQREVNTGANLYEVTASDVNNSDVIGRFSNGYLTHGHYNTVFIPFPEQPRLDDFTSYRIGYKLADDAYFALAQESQGSYRVASPTRPDTYDTIIRFRDNDTTAQYAHCFPANQYQTMIIDPSYVINNYSTFASFYTDVNPMIRMIVGPATAVERTDLSITVDFDDDSKLYFLGQEISDTTFHPAMGSAYTFRIDTDPMNMAVVEVDDERYYGNDQTFFTHMTDGDVDQYTFTLPNITEIHSLYIKTERKNGINVVKNGAQIKLQPNPASSYVSLSVGGMVGLAQLEIVDMSGRALHRQPINASESTPINVSAFGPGAYFIRVTNGNLTCVEKLIIR